MVNRIRDGWPYGEPGGGDRSSRREERAEPDDYGERPPLRERAERPERSERPERPERPERAERSQHEERLERIARDDYARDDYAGASRAAPRADDWPLEGRTRVLNPSSDRPPARAKRGGGAWIIAGFVVGVAALLVGFYQFGERQSRIAGPDDLLMESTGVVASTASAPGWAQLDAADMDEGGDSDVAFASADGLAHSYDVVDPRALAAQRERDPIAAPLIVEGSAGEVGDNVGAGLASQGEPEALGPMAALSVGGASTQDNAQLWARAGTLAAELEGSLSCSQFSVRAGENGAPALSGEVVTQADLAQARSVLADEFAGAADVTVGLGCTRDLGGGFLAITNERDQIRLMSIDEVGAEIRAVLPEQEDCSVVGWVVDSLPEVRARLAEAGQAGFWVVASDRLTLCQSADGAWRALEERGVDRARGGALFYRGAALAQDAARDSGEVAEFAAAPVPAAVVTASPTPNPVASAPALTPAAPTPSLTVTAPSPSAATTTTASVDLGDPVAVAPVSGPQVRWPSSVAPTGRDVSVVMQFTVGEGGVGSEFVVGEADSYDPAIIATAVQVMEASRFPPPSDTQPSGYKGMHRVVFRSPPITSASLEAPLAGVVADAGVAPTAPPARSTPSVVPLWEENLTASDFERAYPERAKRREMDGKATLMCKVLLNRRPACLAVGEDPAGWGFGAAAIELTEDLVAQPQLPDGRSSVGSEFSWEFVFRLE